MTPRFYRISFFVFAGLWAFFGVWALAQGDYVKGAFDLALGVAWLLIALFRDRLIAARERQRAPVEDQGAISFSPDRDSRRR